MVGEVPQAQTHLGQLRNIGPKCIADMQLARIQDPQTLRSLGVEKAFLRILLARSERGISNKRLSVNYLYALHGAIHDLDWRDIPQTAKHKYRTLLADIRTSHQFGI